MLFPHTNIRACVCFVSIENHLYCSKLSTCGHLLFYLASTVVVCCYYEKKNTFKSIIGKQSNQWILFFQFHTGSSSLAFEDICLLYFRCFSLFLHLRWTHFDIIWSSIRRIPMQEKRMMMMRSIVVMMMMSSNEVVGIAEKSIYLSIIFQDRQHGWIKSVRFSILTSCISGWFLWFYSSFFSMHSFVVHWIFFKVFNLVTYISIETIALSNAFWLKITFALINET